MAQVLRTAGFDVVGMDVSPEMRELFDGAVAPSLAAMEGAEIVVTMLPEGRHVAQVHQDIIRPGAAPGTLLIDCSTIDVDTARDLAAKAEAQGLAMLDAPVSGGPTGAEAGTLSFMVGGADEAFSKASPVLDAMGAKITHFGAAGSGQAAKACHNMICGITAMAVVEGFALADALQAGPAQVLRALRGGGGAELDLAKPLPDPRRCPGGTVVECVRSRLCLGTDGQGPAAGAGCGDLHRAGHTLRRGSCPCVH
jgi:3-hydroxyisobutyrate dehydrogenase